MEWFTLKLALFIFRPCALSVVVLTLPGHFQPWQRKLIDLNPSIYLDGRKLAELGEGVIFSCNNVSNATRSLCIQVQMFPGVIKKSFKITENFIKFMIFLLKKIN